MNTIETRSFFRMRSAFALFCLIGGTAQGQTLPDFGRWDTVAVYGETGEAMTHPWTGGITAPQFSAADLDGDGIEDLLVFDRSGHRMLPFQGCTSESVLDSIVYLYRPDWRSAFPTDIRNWALLRDANCDGVADLFHNSQSGFRIWYGEYMDGLVGFPNAPTTNVFGNWDFGTGDQVLPLICLNSDIPALDDFDNDGDLDMVTWTETSSSLYAYTGRGATEGSVGCGDTLIWDVTNRCYGMLNEASENNDLFIGEDHTCGFNVADPRLETEDSEAPMRHAGGTTALLELDGDGHLDLLLGDVSYSSLTACYMGDAQDGQDSTTSTNDTWPADLGGVALDLLRFPAAYPLDVDQDGNRDLILAVNETFEIDGRRGAWHYRNDGTDQAPIWSLQSRDFLQNQMIDLGRGAYPAFTDFNQDGLLDMVVSCKERYLGPGNTPSLLSRFQNVGTESAPAFAQLDTNWLSIPTYGVESVSAAFGDLDGDGDDELLLGDELGYLHLWTNTAEPGTMADYNLSIPSVTDATGAVIDVGQFATPVFDDLDGDSDLDLLVGEKNGGIVMFENTGTTETAEFTFVTASAGLIDIDNEQGINGFPTPKILEYDNQTWLISGNELGRIQVFSMPENPLANAESEWPEWTNNWNGFQEGLFSAPAAADLDNDGIPDLVVGGRDGGLTLWRGGAEDAIRICSPLVDGIDNFPNPTAAEWRPAPNPISAGSQLEVPSSQLVITDVTGREIACLKAQAGSVRIPLDLPSGTYLIRPEGTQNAPGASPTWKSARRLVVVADR
jgi:hypothetical protein